jgi:hypothetical protein
MFEAGDRNTWHKVTRQVQDFLAPLAADGLFGPAAEAGATYVICDERVNPPQEVAAGRVNVLVGLQESRPGEYRVFQVTHAADGSRVRPVRSTLLPAGTHMTTRGLPEDHSADDTQRQRTVAQELFGYYREPRPAQAEAVFPPLAETSAAGRRDLDALARHYRDLHGRG